MKFKVGQIYFLNITNSLFARLITLYNKKFFKRSDCIHVGIIAGIREDEVLIYEATEKGFVSSWYPNYWLNARIKEGKVKIGECNEPMKDVYGNCETYKGIGYGWLDIIGLGLHYLFGYKIRGVSGTNALICSEAVTRVIYDSTKKVNFAKEFNIPYDAITPQHIFLSKFVKILN